MRRLFLVPLIHSKADLGKAGELIARMRQRTRAEKSRVHELIMKTFWDDVAVFLDTIKKENLVIYQDGLVQGGDIGEMIIKEGAAAGSRNFRVILGLMAAGAAIRQTEDLDLVKREYAMLMEIVAPGPLARRLKSYFRYFFSKNKILKQRDQFIARQINTTLRSRETGILFAGIYHNAHQYLDRDIRVIQVKPLATARKYYRMLTGVYNVDEFKNVAGKLLK